MTSTRMTLSLFLLLACPASAQKASVVDYTPELPPNATWPLFSDAGNSVSAPGTIFTNQGSGRGQAWVDLIGPDPSDPTSDKTGPPDGIPDLLQINSNSPGLPISGGPGTWLVPPVGAEHHSCVVYRGEADGTFMDVTHRVSPNDLDGFGLNYPGGSPWGAVCADYDDDGLMDVFVPCGGFNMESPNALFRNLGNGTFANLSAASGFGVSQPTFGASWLDYDRDGDLDLFVTNSGASWPEYFQGSPVPDPTDRLYRNDGDATFTEVGDAADVNLKSNGFSCAASDLDHNGWPDLVVSCFRQMNKAFYNEGDGTFSFMAPAENTEVQITLEGTMVPDPAFPGTEDIGVLPPDTEDKLPVFGMWSMPVQLEDYNADGWTDIVFSSWSMQLPDGNPDSAENAFFSPWDEARMYLNLGDQDGDRIGDGFYREVASEVGVAHVGGAMGLMTGDFNGDGFLDLYFGCGGPQVDAHKEEDYLYINDGAAWPANFQADPQQPLSKVFYEIGALAGVYPNTSMAHGLTAGRHASQRIDMLIGNGGPAVFDDGQPNVYYRNDGNADLVEPRYLEIDVVAERSTRFGARLELIRTSGTGGATRVIRERRSGEAFASHNDAPLLFGLGDGWPLWVGTAFSDGVRGGHLIWPELLAESIQINESDLSLALTVEEGDDDDTDLRLELENLGTAPLTPYLVYLLLGEDVLGLPTLLGLVPIIPPPTLQPGVPFEATGSSPNLPAGLHAIVAVDFGTLEIMGTAAAWHDPAVFVTSAGADGDEDASGDLLWSDGQIASPETPSAPHDHVSVGRSVELTAEKLLLAPATVPLEWREYDLADPGSLTLASGDALVWAGGWLRFELNDSTAAAMSFNDGYALLTTGRPMGCCDQRPIEQGQLLRFAGLEGPMTIDSVLYSPSGEQLSD